MNRLELTDYKRPVRKPGEKRGMKLYHVTFKVPPNPSQFTGISVHNREDMAIKLLKRRLAAQIGTREESVEIVKIKKYFLDLPLVLL